MTDGKPRIAAEMATVEPRNQGWCHNDEAVAQQESLG